MPCTAFHWGHSDIGWFFESLIVQPEFESLLQVELIPYQNAVQIYSF